MYAHEKISINVQIRVFIALGVALFCFFVLVIRLWYLQVYRGSYFRDQSENNRRKIVYLPPPRGVIMDRHGEVVVKNKPAFNIEFDHFDSPDPEKTLKRLAAILEVDEAEVLQNFKRHGRRRRYEPKIIFKNVSRDTVARVAARGYDLPGIMVNHYPARDYVYGNFASHVIGYIREVTRKQLASPQFSQYGYRRGDLVGQFGIESRWEQRLQGKRGRREVTVNARGVRTGELSYDHVQAGKGIQLTLDRRVQQAADLALEGKAGAIVALNPHTGEVLAMSSAPGFDPNIFAGELSQEEWADLVGGPEKRLSNRAVQGAYPPGSVFKAIMGTAGLSDNVISTGERIYCPGFLRFGSRNYHCHKRSGHGYVNLRDALVVSCDVYFYVLGQRLGVNGIHAVSTKFGLGKATGLGLVQESPGLVPSTDWKARRFKGTEQEKWYPGETLSVAIGQGAMLATPLQMANAVAAIVNGGQVYRPQIIKAITDAGGKVIDDEFPPEVISRLEVDGKILAAIRDGLKGVVNDTRGTGRRAKVSEELNVTVAGKTGTSQVVALSRKTKDKRFEHHAWFVGYAPADNPEIVVAALVEHGGGGGKAAAPLVSQVFEAYFQARKPEPPDPSDGAEPVAVAVKQGRV